MYVKLKIYEEKLPFTDKVKRIRNIKWLKKELILKNFLRNEGFKVCKVSHED